MRLPAPTTMRRQLTSRGTAFVGTLHVPAHGVAQHESDLATEAMAATHTSVEALPFRRWQSPAPCVTLAPSACRAIITPRTAGSAQRGGYDQHRDFCPRRGMGGFQMFASLVRNAAGRRLHHGRAPTLTDLFTNTRWQTHWQTGNSAFLTGGTAAQDRMDIINFIPVDRQRPRSRQFLPGTPAAAPVPWARVAAPARQPNPSRHPDPRRRPHPV